MVEFLLLIAGSFLIGSIPTGYLAARLVGNIDIREYGSGNVGGSNVMAHVNPLTGVAVGTFDCVVKGVIPVLIGRELGLNLWLQGAVGFVAIAGHNWSPFLKFAGGRGVATSVGVALALMMWREILILGLVILIVGRLATRDTGLWTFISLIALPFAGLALRQPIEVVWAAGCIGLLLLLKRLTANWEPPPPQSSLARVLMYRLIWDRDVLKRVEWTDRRPG